MDGYMRTPNTECILCNKPLYRRPSDMKKARYAACIECRSEAQKVVGITDKQNAALSLRRQPGIDNGRTGYKHSEESKRKASETHIAYWAANPDKALERGAKTRGDKHRLWNGGANKLNTSIRQMHENRKWMDAVKDRDGCCQDCGATENLEAHHKVALAELIERLCITDREDARKHADVLWDLDNGKTLCQPCHYAEHGRTYNEDHAGHIRTLADSSAVSFREVA